MKASSDVFGPAGTIDLNRRPETEGCVAGREEVNSFLARGDERLDVILTRQPGPAVGVVALRSERRRAGIDGGLPMGDAVAVDAEVLGRVAGVGEAADGDGRRAAIGRRG